MAVPATVIVEATVVIAVVVVLVVNLVLVSLAIEGCVRIEEGLCWYARTHVVCIALVRKTTGFVQCYLVPIGAFCA